MTFAPTRRTLLARLDEQEGPLLTLTHEQFFDEKARDDHRDGWGMALDKLEELFARTASAFARPSP